VQVQGFEMKKNIVIVLCMMGFATGYCAGEDSAKVCKPHTSHKKQKSLHEKFVTTKKPVTEKMVEGYEQLKTKDVLYAYSKPRVTFLGRLNSWVANKWQKIRNLGQVLDQKIRDDDIRGGYYIANRMRDMSPEERAEYLIWLYPYERKAMYLPYLKERSKVYDLTESE